MDLETQDVKNYVPNIEALDTTEKLAKFIGELGVYITVFGEDTPETLGKTPEFWVPAPEGGTESANDSDI